MAEARSAGYAPVLNSPGIVGLGKAAELAQGELESEALRLSALRDRLVDGVFSQIDYVKLNGPKNKRAPGIANITFEFVEGESMLMLLDHKGICASTGSACASGSLNPSHVLMAMGLEPEKAHGSLRFSMGRYTTEAEVDEVLSVLVPMVQRLREMSPTYPGHKAAGV
jgi:cysteine desulfurase